MRTQSQNDRAKRVMRSGQIIALLSSLDKPELTGRIYRTKESRGYKTDFSLKDFFYIISFENAIPVNIEGITKDCRRKDILNHFEQNNIEFKITNQESWDLWVK